MSNCKHGIPGFASFLKVIRIEHYPVKDTYYCSKCKADARKAGKRYYGYDSEMLGTDICPDCGSKMKHPTSSHKVYKCMVCGEEIG